MGTLTLLVTATSDGITITTTLIEPLTEAALLSAGVSLISQKPDDRGRIVVALRAALK